MASLLLAVVHLVGGCLRLPPSWVPFDSSVYAAQESYMAVFTMPRARATTEGPMVDAAIAFRMAVFHCSTTLSPLLTTVRGVDGRAMARSPAGAATARAPDIRRASRR